MSSFKKDPFKSLERNIKKKAQELKNREKEIELNLLEMDSQMENIESEKKLMVHRPETSESYMEEVFAERTSSIHKPLRFQKRRERNLFIILTIILFGVLFLAFHLFINLKETSVSPL